MKFVVIFSIFFVGWELFGADLKSSNSNPFLQSEANVTPEDPLSFDENFHLSIAYNSGNFNLNLADPSALTEEPQSGIYEDGKPASGIFSGGGIREFRALMAYLWPNRKQLFSLGFGLSNMELGSPGPPMTKGASNTSFHINSITSEFSVLKKIPRFGYTKGTVSLDSMIDGRLRTQYLIRTDGSTATIENSLKSGFKLGINGEYHFNVTTGLSFGFNAGLQYGILQVKNYSGKSSLFGLSYGMSILLRI